MSGSASPQQVSNSPQILPTVNATTYRDLIEFIDSEALKSLRHLVWPADTFALAAFLLHATGVYREVLSEWPPTCGVTCKSGENWREWVKRVGGDWRKSFNESSPVPNEVKDAWDQVTANIGLGISRNGAPSPDAKHRELACGLIALTALADGACSGVGLPTAAKNRDKLLDFAGYSLSQDRASLAQFVSHEKARVLPKLHTPRDGITLRSLTHNLSLHVGNDVEPRWRSVPQVGARLLNILLAPWPLKIWPAQFKPAGHGSLPEQYRRMDFSRESEPSVFSTWMKGILANAEKLSGRVHGIVLPEASLTPGEFDALKQLLSDRDIFVLAGVFTQPDAPGKLGRNRVHMWAREKEGGVFSFDQSKHHRWRLTQSQVEMYGLAVSLDPHVDWWENIEIPQREINFAALNDGTTICCLVCEDLARMDPVSALVRSVGPNLVIALLMDGPQLALRWPARYATVLAEDPGCSVLTLTSLGMAELTKPPAGKKNSRSIALWKDSRPGTTEVDLPEGTEAALLTLCNEKVEEFSADGRSDGKVTEHPRLSAIHYLSSKAT